MPWRRYEVVILNTLKKKKCWSKLSWQLTKYNGTIYIITLKKKSKKKNAIIVINVKMLVLSMQCMHEKMLVMLNLEDIFFPPDFSSFFFYLKTDTKALKKIKWCFNYRRICRLNAESTDARWWMWRENSI